ncbi:MAG: bi-domain-containing oxidoreductase [Bacteroidetes bacterium]|nr:bi-domain-containing oxidoreductase [Bacteroidota bacterium]
MKQLIQNFKSGELYVDEVPLPSLSKGFILVENHCSLISSGTERGTVKVAQASLLGKAKQRPDLVAQVMRNLKKEGFTATFKKVQTRLDSLKALGYSTAGVVMASMDTDHRIKPGDRVACAGQDYASHAEIVSVPQNLVARVPENVSFEEAAFTTLGAIALQGIRQAEPQLGEYVCVIGLGILGQLTGQMLKANGCKVMGIDLSSRLVELAAEHSTDKSLIRSDLDLLGHCEAFTNGQGFDSIIITAAAPTNDPLVLAGEIARKKARIVIVGAVKMDIPRDPHYYRKELELRMSCSYGPGRYDTSYEEDGVDYPMAYVRWTEQRNMEAFLSLLSRKLINVKPLISHTFDVDHVTEAYDLVLGRTTEPSVGILVKYPQRDGKYFPDIMLKKPSVAKICVGFIGAGSFAQSYLLPNLKGKVSLHTVVTSKGINAKNVADKFGFDSCGSDPAKIFESQEINTVFIATPHSSHSVYAAQALKMGKHVFVEKPLAITYEGLKEVEEARRLGRGLLMVGFNRRFAPISRNLKRMLKNNGDPLIMNFRVNAGFIPKDHWVQKEDVGGGRIVGEICHFIDLMIYFSDSRPVSVFAETMRTPNGLRSLDDTLAVTIRFENGSVGNMVYVSNGDNAMPKEHLEFFANGKSGIINDFQYGTLFQNNREKVLKLRGKGHLEEVDSFLNAIHLTSQEVIPFHELVWTTLASLKIKESIATGLPQIIEG